MWNQYFWNAWNLISHERNLFWQITEMVCFKCVNSFYWNEWNHFVDIREIYFLELIQNILKACLVSKVSLPWFKYVKSFKTDFLGSKFMTSSEWYEKNKMQVFSWRGHLVCMQRFSPLSHFHLIQKVAMDPILVVLMWFSEKKIDILCKEKDTNIRTWN